MGEVVPADPVPALCPTCHRTGFWRYHGRPRWHCVACAPCLEPDGAVFAYGSVLVNAEPPVAPKGQDAACVDPGWRRGKI